jgi:enoyl-CoA hydratase/carnithine racemase
MNHPVRIANCSGFYGDRVAAVREMVEGGPIDVLTGDYLAELTMLILTKKLLNASTDANLPAALELEAAVQAGVLRSRSARAGFGEFLAMRD